MYVLTARAALNLSYQERTPVRGAPELLLELSGQDLIGTPVRCAPPRRPLSLSFFLRLFLRLAAPALV